jgi:hypothetical protein
MNWLGLVGSLAGVLALGAIAWWLGLGRTEPLTKAEAEERAAFEFGPLQVRESFVDLGGQTAVVFGADQQVVALKRHGTQPATRLLSRPVQWRAENDRLLLGTRDGMFGDLVIRLPAEERDRLTSLL